MGMYINTTIKPKLIRIFNSNIIISDYIKVECNRSVEEIAVDKRGEEAEEILNTFHSWTSQAIGRPCLLLMLTM